MRRVRVRRIGGVRRGVRRERWSEISEEVILLEAEPFTELCWNAVLGDGVRQVLDDAFFYS